MDYGHTIVRIDSGLDDDAFQLDVPNQFLDQRALPANLPYPQNTLIPRIVQSGRLAFSMSNKNWEIAATLFN